MQSLFRSISSLRGTFTSSSRLTYMRTFSETAAEGETQNEYQQNYLIDQIDPEKQAHHPTIILFI